MAYSGQNIGSQGKNAHFWKSLTSAQNVHELSTYQYLERSSVRILKEYIFLLEEHCLCFNYEESLNEKF